MNMLAIPLLLSISFADSLPTQEAVDASRAEWAAANPPPTQEEAIAKLQRHLDLVEANLAKMRRSRNVNKAQSIREMQAEIKDLETQLRDVTREYSPPPGDVRLMPMDWKKLTKGSVGRVGIERRMYSGTAVEDGQVRCIQILGPDEFLGEYEYTSISPSARDTTERPAPSRKVHSGLLHITGVSTDGMREDKIVPDFDRSMVVTGQYTYEAVDGSMATVPALRAFDVTDFPPADVVADDTTEADSRE